MTLLLELHWKSDDFFFTLSLARSIGSIVEVIGVQDKVCIADFLHGGVCLWQRILKIIFWKKKTPFCTTHYVRNCWPRQYIDGSLSMRF